MYEKFNAVLRFFVGRDENGKVRLQYDSPKCVPFLQNKCGTLGLGEWKPLESGGVVYEWHNK